MHKVGLTIDLNALAKNYRSAQTLSGRAETACVVKANAYGLGIKPIALTLSDVGAKSFFVATPEEGAELRAILPQAAIYIFNGLLLDRTELYVQYQLRPCLASLEEINTWLMMQNKNDNRKRLTAALHLDTGINRLGLSLSDFDRLKPQTIDQLAPDLLLSHLACADNPDHAMNALQYKRFDLAQKKLDCRASLANSAGLFLSSIFAFDMTRPGIALYGGDPLEVPHPNLPFKPVIHLTGQIAQTRSIKKNEYVGYGALFRAKRTTQIAIIPTGYADGYARAAKNSSVYIDNHPVPLIGQISMDMLIIDITDLPHPAKRGDLVELLGHHITLSDLARSAQTIPHNIATALGKRLPRHYIGAKHLKDEHLIRE